MIHRIREAWDTDGCGSFRGPIKVEETYMGGKERNKHNSEKQKAGRGSVGKAAVVGMKDRDTNRVSAAVVDLDRVIPVDPVYQLGQLRE